MTSRQRGTAGIILLFIIIIGDIISGLASSHVIPADVDPHDTNSLGTWLNMPSATTELMGNTTYRSLLIPASITAGLPAIVIGLAVNCIVLSNTPGATLELQDAVWDMATQTNTTNFGRISTGVIVGIDGIANPGCMLPNSFGSTTGAFSPGTTAGVGQGYVFRVVGNGGGGIGDNPRFGSVNVLLYANYARIFNGRATSVTTTGFTANIAANLISGTAQTVTYNWLATNITSTNCGTGDHCFESSNAGSCSIAANQAACVQTRTFTTAFVGTPNVFIVATQASIAIQYNLGQLNLLRAQTLTV